MKKQTILIASTLILIVVSAVAYFMTFNEESNDNNYVSLVYAPTIGTNSSYITIVEDEGYTLMKANCYICHNPNAASHDEVIAPPFKAVKNRYTKEYDTKEEFVNAVVKWVRNPLEEKALMYGAVEQYKVMPQMMVEVADLEKIASYLYDNKVDEPKWMNEHMKEGKGKGYGQGNGMGKGKGKGMGKGRGM